MRILTQGLFLVSTGCMLIVAGCNNGNSGSSAPSSTTTAGGSTTQQGTSSGVTLKGAGSTFINPIMSKWGADYQAETGTAINYQANGSGGGIKALIDHTVDFAGSDAPMNDKETADAKAPVLHLPAVIGTTCIAYNVQGLQPGLHLSGPVIADIFLGNITKWNDAKIAALNSGVALPDAPITVAHRSDGSGTTYIFSDYLSKVSPEWKAKVGVGKSLKWPVGQGGKGSDGVAAQLKNHAGSIGYVELTYATQNNIPFAAVQNAKGQFVSPSPESGSAAAEGATIPDDMKASITNTDSPAGYPITGFSWIIVYKNSTNADDLKKFLSWVLTKGQDQTKPLGYAPIPDALRKKEQTMIDSIQKG